MKVLGPLFLAVGLATSARAQVTADGWTIGWYRLSRVDRLSDDLRPLLHLGDSVWVRQCNVSDCYIALDAQSFGDWRVPHDHLVRADAWTSESATAGRRAEAERLRDRDSIPALPARRDATTLFRSHLLREKGAFETTEEYEDRRARLPAGAAAIVLDRACFSLMYDADSALLWVSLVGGGVTHLPVRLRSHLIRRYVGRNGFNASVHVSVYRDSLLAFSMAWRQGGEFSGIAVPMDRASARNVMRRLQLIALVDVLPDPTVESVTSSEATFASPEQRSTHNSVLRIDAARLVLFDPVTGRALAARKL